MASRPYSVRFLSGAGTAVDKTFVVPAGYRAVVRAVSGGGGGVAGDYLQCFVAGVNTLTYTFPVAERSRFFDVRWVAYAGEAIRAACGGSQGTMHVSGFLFVESALAAAEREELDAAIADEQQALEV